MNTFEKLKVLGAGAVYDRCGCEASVKEARGRRRLDVPQDGIYPVAGPDGRRTVLLKVLQTNECMGDCLYCMNRCERDTTRARFEPPELAGLFRNYFSRGLVEGLFLSSGLGVDAERSMEDVLETVELVRRQGFRGYVHTKILPGATREQVRRAAALSTRVSVNVEAPDGVWLSELSSTKDFRLDLLKRIRWVSEEVMRGRVPAGQTTQFIVGAVGESDAEILEAVWNLYGKMNLSRCYFSAFNPVKKTPFEEKAKVAAVREHRLYQADFLLRRYGFKLDELVFDKRDFLPVGIDPKTLFAQEHPEMYPVDVNEADYLTLLRVPGIGPKTAEKIVSERGYGRIRETRGLTKFGLLKKSLHYLKIKGTSQRRLGEYCM